MVKQSGFAGARYRKQFPDLKQGTDYDFFVVPGAQGLQGWRRMDDGIQR